jgi:hypothetical protein
MVKAFYNLKTLHKLYKELSDTYQALSASKGMTSLTYKDKLVFETLSFALPVFEDYFNDNLESIVNYLRIRSIIEACSLMSMGEEKIFKDINVPLFEDQFALINYRTYFTFTPDFVSIHDLKNQETEAKAHFTQAIKLDENHTFNKGADDFVEAKMPMILGRSLKESIRVYLGYIFEGEYDRSGEMIHLIDYRDLDDKYAISFFNDMTRMMMKISLEYSFDGEGKKPKSDKNQADSINNVCSDLEKSYLALAAKFDSRFPKSFISAAFTRLAQVERSFENALEKGRYYEVNTLFKIMVEWLANVDSISSEASAIVNFNFGEELNKLGEEERELKFVAMRNNLITPNLIWQRSTLRQIVYAYIDSLTPSPKMYFGLSQSDYLKMKYYESQASSHGNGYLFYASPRYYGLEKDLVLLVDQMVKELLDKIRLTMHNILDISVEEETVKSALGKKDALILSL